MEAVPEAELDSINWEVGNGEAHASALAEQAPMANAVPNDSEAATVRGTLRFGSSANARQILEAFNRLVEALRANPTLKIDALQQPFDIEPGKLLKGADTTLENSKPRSFSLRITRKLES